MQRKPDDAAIGAFFDDLARQPWLGPERRRWPDFLFHITDVRNAASILHMGRLLSRARAIEAGAMANDQADPDIIRLTSDEFRDHARLYFRPRTPTMYRNEGFRPRSKPSMGRAHCPMPVALLFDARQVAGMLGVKFSNQSVAHRRCRIGDDAAFLRSLNFADIYSSLNSIVEPKHAEVLVPGDLSLRSLRQVVVRTPAERQTLLSLLAEFGGFHPVLADFHRSVVVDNMRSPIFYRHWTYIQTIHAAGGRIHIRSNPSSRTPGPFFASIAWSNDSMGQMTFKQYDDLILTGYDRHPIPRQLQLNSFRLRIELDGHLAYLGQVDPTEETLF